MDHEDQDLPKMFNFNIIVMDSIRLEKSIKSTFKLFESFYDTNDIDSVIAETEPFAGHNLYYSALKSIMSILKSALTLDENDIERASKSATQTAQLCDKYRRRGLFEKIMSYLRTPDYNNYSEIEIHAELTFAMLMGYSGILGLTNCHTIMDFLRIINRLRLSKNSYKECRKMYENRTHWESEISRINFKACISVERGSRHLIISLLPPKVLRLVNFFGYRGVRSIAFEELNGAAFELTGIYCKFSESLLLIYHLYIETFISFKQNHSIACDNILKKGLEAHPNSIIYKIFEAKSNLVAGKIDVAIKQYEDLLKTDIKIFHKLSHFELMWCYAFKCDWDQCIKYSQQLRLFAFISPTLFTYFEAVFRYVKSVETNDEKLREEANELFRSIPTLRTLYYGFTLTYELMAIECSKAYFENNEFLILPVIEMIYTWNYFITIDGNISLLGGLLKKVENELQTYAKELEITYYADNYLSALFYKGVILKFMGRLDDAQNCFNEIRKEEHHIHKCQSIIPQTVMELGLIQILLSNYEEARKLLNQALSDYSGYTSEFLLHAHIYFALRQMGVDTGNTDVVHGKIVEQYADVLHDVEVLDDDNNRHELLRF